MKPLPATPLRWRREEKEEESPVPRGKTTAIRNSNTKSPASSSENSRVVGAYAVQCGNCFKWRLIPTQEEYETIRHSFSTDPWVCDKKPNVSCDDPGDLEYDSTRLWVIDKPNIPNPPPGCQRRLIMRKDFSKMDAHYVMPNGKRVRSCVEVEKFLEANPKYKGQFSVADFSFTVPKIMDDTFPGSSRGGGSVSGSKRMNKSKTEC